MDTIIRLKSAFSSCNSLTLNASWDLALFQVDVAISNDVEADTFISLYSILIDQQSDFWDILLSAVIIYSKVIPNFELQRKFSVAYSDFLSCQFSRAHRAMEEDYIRVHSFFANKILACSCMNHADIETISLAILCGIQNTAVAVSTDESQSLVNITTRPLLELMSNLLRGACDNTQLRDVVFFKFFDFLKLVSDVIMKIPSMDCRCVIAKLIIVPYFQLIVTNTQTDISLEDLLLSCWTSLCVPLLKVGDIDTTSIVGFSVVDTAVVLGKCKIDMDRMSSVLGNFHEAHSVWDLCLRCLQHKTSLVVRKRGARMLHDWALVYRTQEGAEGEKSWCRTYLNVYQQLEGCMSMHLVSQVWGDLNCLIRESLPSANDADTSPGMATSQPPLTFPWIVVLLRCVLSSQHLPIKKAFLRKILIGELAIPISSASIDWVCGELLMTLDSTVYFTTAFSEFPEEILWKQRVASGDISVLAPAISSCDAAGGGETGSDDSVANGIINSSSHPGVLLPLFLGQWILDLAHQYRKCQSRLAQTQLERLIQAITSTVCGSSTEGFECNVGSGSAVKATTFKSLSAVKWVLRVFSFEAVQNCLMDNDSPICNIGRSALSAVTMFIKEKFFTMSRIITVQVYAGLVPLLLCTRHSDTAAGMGNIVDPCARKVEQLRAFMDMMSTVGLHNVLTSQKGWRLLKLAMLETILLCDNTSAASTGPSSFELVCDRPMNSSYAAVWMGIVGGIEKNTASDAAVVCELAGAEEVCKMMFQLAGRLYSSSYMSVDEQWRVVWFLRGTTSFLCSVFNAVPSEDEILRGCSSDWVYQHDYTGEGAYLLRRLGESGHDVLSYLSFVLQAAALEGPKTGWTTERLEITEMEEFLSLLDILCDTLSLLFADPNYCLSDFEAAMNIVSGLVQKLTSELNRLNGCVPENLSANESFSKLLCTVVCGRCLHLFRSIAQHSSVSSGAVNKHKGAVLFDMVEVFTKAFAVLHATQAVSFALTSDNNADAPIIMHDMRQRFQSFGKYYDAVFSSKWLGISATLHLIRICDQAHDGGQFTFAASTEMCSRLLDEAIEHIGLCSKEAMSHMLNCARILVDHLHKLHHQQSEDSVSNISERLEELLFAAWTACSDGDGVCYQNVKLFIQLCFDFSTLRVITASAQQKLFELILALGAKTKPYVIQFLAYRLFSACAKDHTLSFPFFKYFQKLLLYREPLLDDHNLTDSYHDCDGSDGAYMRSVYSVLDYSRVTGIDRYTSSQSVRVIVMQFLEASSTVKDNILKEYVQDLIVSLVKLSRDKQFVRQSMVGSEKFGEKLRCWQVLCVLVPYVDEELLVNILDSCFQTLADPCAHAIRVHMELFLAALANLYPGILIPRLLSLLKNFNHAQQVLASYFIIIGHLVKCDMYNGVLGNWKRAIVMEMMPWLTCAAGLSRAIAQYVSYTLIPEVTSSNVFACDSDKTVDGMWSEIWRFLHENKDAIKLRQKQDNFFTSFTVPGKCSVGGLLSMHHDQYGEHVPEHILTMLLAAVRSNLLYDEAGDGYADSFKALPPTSLDNVELKRHTDSDQLQTKITPFDELQLAIETNLLSRQRNGTDRVRQDLIVCASLIDKVTNLAGIVRTCEIFAVKEVTVPDINILQNFEFQSISVASAGWMPIREVSYEDSLETKTAAARSGELVRYLREMKAMGYQIIGVEQTGASVPLQHPEVINPKCVLVLGKEKEGIPLDILHEVDICIEIPQFGVTRSLNVHVSAALVIWEVTKRSIAMKDSPLAVVEGGLMN